MKDTREKLKKSFKASALTLSSLLFSIECAPKNPPINRENIEESVQRREIYLTFPDQTYIRASTMSPKAVERYMADPKIEIRYTEPIGIDRSPLDFPPVVWMGLDGR